MFDIKHQIELALVNSISEGNFARANLITSLILHKTYRDKVLIEDEHIILKNLRLNIDALSEDKLKMIYDKIMNHTGEIQDTGEIQEAVGSQYFEGDEEGATEDKLPIVDTSKRGRGRPRKDPNAPPPTKEEQEKKEEAKKRKAEAEYWENKPLTTPEEEEQFKKYLEKHLGPQSTIDPLIEPETKPVLPPETIEEQPPEDEDTVLRDEAYYYFNETIVPFIESYFKAREDKDVEVGGFRERGDYVIFFNDDKNKKFAEIRVPIRDIIDLSSNPIDSNKGIEEMLKQVSWYEKIKTKKREAAKKEVEEEEVPETEEELKADEKKEVEEKTVEETIHRGDIVVATKDMNGTTKKRVPSPLSKKPKFEEVDVKIDKDSKFKVIDVDVEKKKMTIVNRRKHENVLTVDMNGFDKIPMKTMKSNAIERLSSKGFDESFWEGDKLHAKCSKCGVDVVEGVPLHKAGCPNRGENKWMSNNQRYQ